MYDLCKEDNLQLFTSLDSNKDLQLLSEFWLKKTLFIFVCLMPVIYLACSASSIPETSEQRAQSLDKSIICPICPGETIDQSQVELAKQMKNSVRDMIEKGKSDEEILNYFSDRYGLGVLAAPPKKGFHLFAWWTPIAIIAIGITLTIIAIRSKIVQPPKIKKIETSYDFISSLEFQQSLQSIEKDTQEFDNGIEEEKE
jgi:cytochrome c-type biogenesis protein CcmH